ncbi:MAG: phospholipid/glycerol acyltransferase [Verrucomicrobiales bacterium]|nr:phospholipid/glycerol acyltransferase [Verrucomicrobiales bacterium]
MKTPASWPTGTTLPPASPVFVKMFAAYSRRYVGQHFHSLRILKSGMPPRGCGHPLVIHVNHAAWWDPLVCLLLAREFFSDRTSFAPIDSAMLARYGFFRKLGFFGVEPRTARGARAFLRTAHAVLASPSQALWLTPQGRFTDTRERPLQFEDGLGALAARGPDAMFVPLAIEYAFWTEPRPEILVSFGAPVSTRESRTTAEWTRTFTGALEAAQDELAACSCRRDPADWLTLSRGRTGVGAIYDTWRRLRARVRGGKFTAEHSPQSAP